MLGNWIRQTTTTTGTGALTLSTVSGYSAFSDQFAAGQRFQYQILDDSTGAPIEAGVGYLSSGTLVRERIECTIVSGTFDYSTPSAVSLAAGTKRVICAASMASVMGQTAGAYSLSGGFQGYGDSISVQPGSTSNLGLTGSRAYATPFIAQSAQEIDALVVRITIAGTSGGLIKGAIYSIGANGLPDVKLAESATAAADTTGQKFLSFTAFRPPQRFYGCLISTNVPSVYATASGLSSNPMGFLSSQEAAAYLYLAASGTTFPSSWSGASADVLGGLKPFLGVRCI
jgi:hypothetical protein